MLFQWLKRYMPRGLYGRAALILILPVVTLQLVVSVVFIQRHFEGVTRQMTTRSAANCACCSADEPPSANRSAARALTGTLGVALSAGRPRRCHTEISAAATTFPGVVVRTPHACPSSEAVDAAQ